MSLLLRNFNGTPDYDRDDKFVFYVSDHNTPASRGIWEAYEFEVPAGRLTAPEDISTTEGEPGWVIADKGGLPAGRRS